MDSTLVDGDTESRLAAGDPRVKSMLQISDSHIEEWESFWLTDTNGKETQMRKRQKWKRVHVLLQFTAVVVGCVINEKMVLELHGLESCLNSTRAHEARVQSQYLIPLFHANVSRWIKKNGTRTHQDRVP